MPLALMESAYFCPIRSSASADPEQVQGSALKVDIKPHPLHRSLIVYALNNHPVQGVLVSHYFPNKGHQNQAKHQCR